jgi:hypothetical protein
LKTVQSGNKDEKQSLNGEEKRGRGRPPGSGKKPLAFETDSVVGDIKKDVRQSGGLPAPVTAPATEQPQEFSDMEANALLDLLQGIEQPMASKVYGVPYEITRQAFVFTDDMRKRINPAMVKILNKWAPTILRNWKDELGFMLVFGSALNMQIQTMHHLEARRKKELPANKINTLEKNLPKTDLTAYQPTPIDVKSTVNEKPTNQTGIKLEGKDTVNLESIGVG